MEIATRANRVDLEGALRITGRATRWIVLACILIAIITPGVWVSVGCLREKRAIKAIEDAGGWVTTERGGSDWLRQYIGHGWMRGFDHVVGVSFWRSGSARVDAALSHLSGLRDIGMLSLSGAGVTDAGFAHLSGLSNVKGLHLLRTGVTDAGLSQLSVLHGLEALVLYELRVTDAGLAHLRGLSNLKGLSLHRTHVTDAGLTHLRGLSNLRSLGLQNTHVTEGGIKALQAALPNCDIDQ